MSQRNTTVPPIMHNQRKKQGRPRKLHPCNEFFLVLCRLRQGLAEQHLAHLFNISQQTVSGILFSWINFMYLKFGQINILPSRKI